MPEEGLEAACAAACTRAAIALATGRADPEDVALQRAGCTHGPHTSGPIPQQISALPYDLIWRHLCDARVPLPFSRAAAGVAFNLYVEDAVEHAWGKPWHKHIRHCWLYSSMPTDAGQQRKGEKRCPEWPPAGPSRRTEQGPGPP